MVMCYIMKTFIILALLALATAAPKQRKQQERTLKWDYYTGYYDDGEGEWDYYGRNLPQQKERTLKWDYYTGYYDDGEGEWDYYG